MVSPARRLLLVGARSRFVRSLTVVVVVVSAIPAAAAADQSSEPSSAAAGRITAGKYHSCAVLVDGSVRCWGYGGYGALGYGNTNTIGGDDTPASAGPVDLGLGRTAVAITAGSYHTCALLDDGTVRCWGYDGDGQLGYNNTNSIGASQTPGSVPPVDLGGHQALAISAGGAQTCALLDDHTVRCWGFSADGRLGYGNTTRVGDGSAGSQTPASVGPVDLGPGRTATAITTGGSHTCALLDDGSVRCWGSGANGQLGYGSTNNVGASQTPGSLPLVDLGGHQALAISAGNAHTCALLDDHTVRCWGFGGEGRLGYGNTNNVGDGSPGSQAPASVGPVDLGAGRTAVAISAGGNHTCAVLDNGSVRCWGFGLYGQLGYGNTNNVGDVQTPGSVGPVDLGAGRTAVAIGTGDLHTCALLDNGSVRCWGYGADGRLGYCNVTNVGDLQTPGSVGPVNLRPGDGGATCAVSPAPSKTAKPSDFRKALRAETRRRRRLLKCLRTAARRPAGQRQAAQGHCNKLYGRTPGRIAKLNARALSRTAIMLTFPAPGSDGTHPPAARAYLVKQSHHPIPSLRDFRRADTLCNGSCHFNVIAVGTTIKLTITHLAPHTTYYYAIAARDNVSNRLGQRSPTIGIRTP